MIRTTRIQKNGYFISSDMVLLMSEMLSKV